MFGLKLKVRSVLKTEMYVKTSRTAEITAPWENVSLGQDRVRRLNHGKERLKLN